MLVYINYMWYCTHFGCAAVESKIFGEMLFDIPALSAFMPAGKLEAK